MNATGSWIKRNEGYLYILPAFLLVSVFGIYPILYTVFVSLHRWRIRRGNFVGFANYRTIFGEWGPFLLLVGAILAVIWSLRLRERSVDAVDDLSRLSGEGRFARMSSTQRRRYVGHLLTLAGGIVLLFLSLPMLHAAGDERMFDSLRVTIWYSLGAVPVQLAGGLFIAWFLNNKFKGRQLFRVLFLTPYIVPTVAGAAIFERLFSIRPESFANQVLMAIGGDPQDWLQEVRGVFDIIFGFGQSDDNGIIASYWSTWARGPSLALVSILFFNWWVFTGYYALIYANGLSHIPSEVYEAAEVDGALRRTVFFRVVLPLLSPTTYFLTLLGVIGTFKSFSHIWVLRHVNARGAADPMSIYIFTVFYNRSAFGYASALSLVLMFIVLLMTLFQNRLMKHKVHYND